VQKHLPPDIEAFNAAINEVEACLDTYEGILKDQRYLTGDVRLATIGILAAAKAYRRISPSWTSSTFPQVSS
jgi:glutathione S-transferase